MSFGSGALLAGIGWTAINIAALSLLALRPPAMPRA